MSACSDSNPHPTHHHIQTRDFINETLLKGFPIGKIDKCSGLRRPVSYETAHQWMLTCGCLYKTAKKSYYNDTHERHDNQLDRVTKSYRHLFVSFREEKWLCLSPRDKQKYALKYPNWPRDELAQRIPKDDVGAFPPNGGTAYYQKQKGIVKSDEQWYEYHTDFLPEEVVINLNRGHGGFVSQRRDVNMPVAAPRGNTECIERLCDLLTVSCPQTLQLLQKEIDRVVIGSDIRCVHTHHAHSHPHLHGSLSLPPTGKISLALNTMAR